MFTQIEPAYTKLPVTVTPKAVNQSSSPVTWTLAEAAVFHPHGVSTFTFAVP